MKKDQQPHNIVLSALKALTADEFERFQNLVEEQEQIEDLRNEVEEREKGQTMADQELRLKEGLDEIRRVEAQADRDIKAAYKHAEDESEARAEQAQILDEAAERVWEIQIGLPNADDYLQEKAESIDNEMTEFARGLLEKSGAQ